MAFRQNPRIQVFVAAAEDIGSSETIGKQCYGKRPIGYGDEEISAAVSSYI